jgi:hypothetical protein
MRTTNADVTIPCVITGNRQKTCFEKRKDYVSTISSPRKAGGLAFKRSDPWCVRAEMGMDFVKRPFRCEVIKASGTDSVRLFEPPGILPLSLTYTKAAKSKQKTRT